MPGGCALGSKNRGSGKKRRTREHVIADLSVNHVEKFVFQCGHSTERIVHDYGIDLLMFTYNENGEIENGHVQLQLKATDNLRVLKDGETVAFSVEWAHIKSWQWEPFPVILVVYDARGKGRALWLYVQNYIETSKIELDDMGDEVTVTFHIPVGNRLGKAAIGRFRGFRDKILARVKGVIRHHD